VRIAIDDGISVREVADRGVADLKMRVAYFEIQRQKESKG
jgi:hypothetical protein